MRVSELVEIDTGDAADAAASQVQRDMQTRRTEAKRDIERAARSFLGAYRATTTDVAALTRVLQRINATEMDSTKMHTLTTLYDTLAAAVPAIQREQRAGDANTPGVNAQLGEVIRNFANNNALAGAFNTEAALLLDALAQR